MTVTYIRVQGKRDDPFDGLERTITEVYAPQGWTLHTITEGNGNERYATLSREVNLTTPGKRSR